MSIAPSLENTAERRYLVSIGRSSEDERPTPTLPIRTPSRKRLAIQMERVPARPRWCPEVLRQSPVVPQADLP